MARAVLLLVGLGLVGATDEGPPKAGVVRTTGVGAWAPGALLLLHDVTAASVVPTASAVSSLVHLMGQGL